MAAPQAWALKGRHAASFRALMLQALMLALLVAFAGYLTLTSSAISAQAPFTPASASCEAPPASTSARVSSPMMGARAMARRCSSAS
jgi:hypothetical protein